MIDLLLLGNGGMQPLPNRWLSSLLVRVDGSLVLFDCGEGTQIPMKQFKWGFRRLAAICLTHHHADHVAGLPGILHSVANAGRTEPLRIFGPPDTGRIVAGLRVIAPDLPYAVEVVELGEDEQFDLPSGLRGRVRFGEHTLPSLAYRVDLPRARRFDARRATELGIPQDLWGPLQHDGQVEWAGRLATGEDVLGPERRGVSFALVTDTRPVPSLVPLIDGVDLLVCEATYSNDDKLEKAHRWGHMSYRESAELARDGHVRQLWLTHFGSGNPDPEADLPNATNVFPDTIAGYSGLTTSLRFGD
ncbi:MAG: Ribonuclease Z [uncultured Thermomicrobiales bacterium]|uniref:Ribonuclease Z n=1 Tax=uncultured Thermomicrobiales bacterium TaxID=1645740 RepID=A0A6J4UY33_9BACT|nr:MAG: Ribonuclease Z [uncultured Thermomicrobiales bacterium]